MAELEFACPGSSSTSSGTLTDAVISLNTLQGDLTISGAGTVLVTTAGDIITVSGVDTGLGTGGTGYTQVFNNQTLVNIEHNFGTSVHATTIVGLDNKVLQGEIVFGPNQDILAFNQPQSGIAYVIAAGGSSNIDDINTIASGSINIVGAGSVIVTTDVSGKIITISGIITEGGYEQAFTDQTVVSVTHAFDSKIHATTVVDTNDKVLQAEVVFGNNADAVSFNEGQSGTVYVVASSGSGGGSGATLSGGGTTSAPLVGVDGITVISGSNITTISGFQSEVDLILNSLIPPNAPSLANISATSSSGPEGKNTWNSAQPIATYIDLPGDGLDTTFSATGNENGVVASGAGAFTGVLNDDVSAHTYAFPDNSFGEADEGTLQLLVGGSIIHSEDLSSFASGATTNARGSGFTLSSTSPVLFESGDPLITRQYRTGTWNVEIDDQFNGYDAIQVKHVVTSGTIQTNLQEWLVDEDTTTTTYSGEALDTLSMTGTKDLSGVNYHTGGTADYDVLISGGQRNTYRTGSAISFNETNVAAITNKAFDATSGNEGQDKVITDETVTINANRLLDGSITVSTTVLRTVQSSPNSAGVSIAGILMDNVSATSTDLLSGFDDEDRRISSDEDFSTDLSATWDSTESLVGADGGHNDGLQVYNSQLIYPVTDFSAITNGPGGNPDYSSAASTRFFYGYFSDSSGASNFRLTLQGSATLIAEAAALGTSNDNIKVSLRAPSQTGWLDVTLAFIEGNFNDGDGCYSASLGSDQTIPTTNLGCTIGTKSTANSFDKTYFRFTVGAGWTGNLTSTSIIWGAS